jgi:TM2 domain-containing membrane protein YozV
MLVYGKNMLIYGRNIFVYGRNIFVYGEDERGGLVMKHLVKISVVIILAIFGGLFFTMSAFKLVILLVGSNSWAQSFNNSALLGFLPLIPIGILIWLGVRFINRKGKASIESTDDSAISDKDFLPTILLCFFLGGFGIHRFFVGKTDTGILMLLTLGGLGIWWLIDLIMIAIGSFKDIEGRAITYQSTNTANTAPSTHVPEKVVEAPPAKDIPAEIEKLADLKDKGIITDEEFQQKKQELLERI